MLTTGTPPDHPPPSIGLAGQQATSRVLSLDIFRGLTMALMIFVNVLSSVHGLSRWTYHMPTAVDAMSYVDIVFPAFLFIVGMAMPLAVRQRLQRDPSVLALWAHVLLRTVALVVLGLILANADLADPSLMHGLRRPLWTLIALLGAMLLWGVFGDTRRTRPRRTRLQQLAGFALLLAALALFRRTTPGGHSAWLAFAYPEILGLIGLTYLAASLLYIPLRRHRWAPVGWLLALLAFDACCMAHIISIAHVPIYLWPFDNGSMPSVILAGILAHTIFLDQAVPWTQEKRINLGLIFAIAALILGWLLVPFGISKNRGTPTWSLWSIAACLIVFTALFWLCDVRRKSAWAAPIRSAGANTLLTYLLPEIYVLTASLFGFSAFLLHWNHGWPGVLRAVIFTCAMLLLSTLLTRAKIRMQL